MRASVEKLRAARRSAGLCYRCGRAPAFKAGRCERHYQEVLAYNRERTRRAARGPVERLPRQQMPGAPPLAAGGEP